LRWQIPGICKPAENIPRNPQIWSAGFKSCVVLLGNFEINVGTELTGVNLALKDGEAISWQKVGLTGSECAGGDWAIKDGVEIEWICEPV
jgi:hypothetical protein